MAIVPRQVEDAFDGAVFDFIASHEGFISRVYSDSRGIPTLGIGYTMVANTPGWPPCETLERDLAAIGIPLTAQDRLLLIDIGEALSCHDLEAVRRFAPARRRQTGAPESRFSFTLTRNQAQALFERNRPDVEVLLQHKLGRDLLAQLAGSWELVALLSLADDSPALIGPALVEALESGARERVWYEIRFGANRGRDARAQRRRNRESTLFGLTNDTISETEREALIALLDDRRKAMKRHLMALGFDETDARHSILRLYQKAGLPLPPCLSGLSEMTKRGELAEGDVAAATSAPRPPQAQHALLDC